MIEKVWDNLYTLDSRGKVRIFTCRINRFEDYYIITTSTGLIEGKKTDKTEVVNKAKGSRDLLAQAMLQADSLWKKKNDEGYKSLKQLKEYNYNVATGYSVIKEYPLDEKHIPILLRNHPLASITNSDWHELPMLAHKEKDGKIAYPCIVQPKLNGVRALSKIEKLISRGGQYYRVPHIQKQILELRTKLIDTIGDYNFIFDGELYLHGKPLQEISGAARTEEEYSTLFASNDWLEYHIYDVINIEESGQFNVDREQIRLAVKIVADDKFPNIKFVRSHICHDYTEVIDSFKQFVEEGYEGAIVRNYKGKYEFNNRSRNLVKIKQFIDEEFEIVGCSFNENKGLGESFVFTMSNNLELYKGTFDARPTGTVAQKEYWFKNIDKYIGKKATIRFFERSLDGVPTMGNLRHELCEFLTIRPDYQ